MNAPIAVEHGAALDQLGRALAAVLASAAERTATADSAGSDRPLGSGDQIQTHNDCATRPRNLGAAVEEDTDRELLTSDADAF